MRTPKWVVVQALPREDHAIEFEFADGKRGIYDARPLLDESCYARLKTLPFFMMGRVEFDTVVWSDEVDIAPENLYDNCRPIAQTA